MRSSPSDDGSIDAGGELLQAPKKVVAPISCGRSAVSQGRIGLHIPYQPLQSRRIDQAVGVEHDHMIIAAAPARHEVLEVARFARDVLPAPPVPNGMMGSSELRKRSTLRVSRIQESALVESERITISKPRCASMSARASASLAAPRGAQRVFIVNGITSAVSVARPNQVVESRRFEAPASTEPAGTQSSPGKSQRKKSSDLQQSHAREAHDLQIWYTP